MKKIIALFVIVFLTRCNIPLHAASMAIDSLTGPVTQNEVNSFKAFMATQVPPATPWGGGAGSHNAWADGPGGNNLEAMGLMYEITGDTTILTNLIGWTDRCVSERNDLMSSANGGQRVMWTGTISKVWVPNDPTSSSATYAGGENGDTKAHIAYTALLILQMPSLWNQTVPDGDPFGYGATYLARAKTYVLRCDEGHDDYDHIFYTSTNTVRNAPGWPSGFHTMEANNIQMMLLGYLERIAQCHEILNDNNAARIAKYDTIVKTASTECINGMKHSSTVNGDTVYKWGYYPWSTSFNESVGHAAYDMVGVYRAFNRSSYGFKLSSLTPFGNAVIDVMNVATNDFSGNVDGSGTTQNYMQAQWLLLGDWVPEVYDVIATADRASTRYKTTTLMEATILWMKDRRFREFSVDAGPASQGVVAGSAATFTATLAPLGGFGGTVNLSVSGLPAGATATFASPAVNLSSVNSPFTNVTVTISTTTSTPGGNYALTIIGASGSVSHSDVVNLAVTPADDFSVSATPSSQAVVVGSSTTYTVNVGSINGFSSAVNLAVSGLPAGTTATFNPASVTPAGTATLTVTTSASTPVGASTLSITGTSGSLAHSATVTLNVTDFSVSATPSTQTVAAGNSTSYTATVGALNGFNGTVNWSVSGLPSGVTATFNPASVTGSGSSTLAITTTASTAPGNYTLTITGTSGGRVHSTTVGLTVTPPPDFSISASPSSQTVTAGGNTTYTATIGALNGFSSVVNLSVSGLPTGATAVFNPTAVTGSGSSTLTVTTSSSTPAGTYTLTITGTSGSLVHSATVTLVVNAVATWTTVNDTGSGITYSAGWSYSTNRAYGDFNSDVHYTKTNANFAQFTFTGTGVRYITETYSDEGNVDVYIDSVLQTTVNCNSATRVAQVVAYTKTGLSAGTHTIKIVKSSGTYMLLDAFAYTP